MLASTVTVVVPAAAVLALIQALQGILTRRKVSEVHVLVNSRLSDALEAVGRLEHELAAVKGVLAVERGLQPPVL